MSMPPMISLAGLAGVEQQPRVPEATGLSSEQIVRLAEFSAAARAHSIDQHGRPADNTAIAVQRVPNTTRHLISIFTRLPKPGSTDPAHELEPIERLVDYDGTILYDDLEGYLERAAQETP